MDTHREGVDFYGWASGGGGTESGVTDTGGEVLPTRAVAGNGRRELTGRRRNGREVLEIKHPGVLVVVRSAQLVLELNRGACVLCRTYIIIII